MKQTRVLELTTREDVQRFCKALLLAKELAPASLSFTVALTIDRVAQTRPTTNGKSEDPVTALFDDIDPEPLPQTELTTDVLQEALDSIPTRIGQHVPARDVDRDEAIRRETAKPRPPAGPDERRRQRRRSRVAGLR